MQIDNILMVSSYIEKLSLQNIVCNVILYEHK